LELFVGVVENKEHSKERARVILQVIFRCCVSFQMRSTFDLRLRDQLKVLRLMQKERT